MSDARKQSLYFPEEMLQQMQEEAIRQDRSLSWIVQHAWRLARERISRLPSSGVALAPASRTVGPANELATASADEAKG
ncbi:MULTISPECIES: TIGR04563 family protein [Anaeromyxobacter]|uniref:TIGR04563 family protein n=1 Tax=Anaeromyxobacter TaxID=161492 RepID=UPI001F562B25|nr:MULTISPECIES: TIGR04563 family protein [unclassified Anaeromyxobacter]